MPYTQNEINAKLIFLIEPEFKKAERFEQKPNRTLALGTIEELFGEFEETDFFKSFPYTTDEFDKKYQKFKNNYLRLLIDTLGTPDFFGVKELFYRDLTLLLEEFQ